MESGRSKSDFVDWEFPIGVALVFSLGWQDSAGPTVGASTASIVSPVPKWTSCGGQDDGSGDEEVLQSNGGFFLNKSLHELVGDTLMGWIACVGSLP